MSDVKNWSTVAANNNASPPNGWPENMAPSAVNNSARENMAAIKRAYLNFPYFCPGGTVSYVDGTTFTIADDALVTDYSQYYSANRRIKAITPTGAVFGMISQSSYSSGSTTVRVVMDGDAVFPSTVTDVYIGLCSDDTSAFQGPNLLGMVLPWTADPESIPLGFGLADGTYFDKNLYPALEALYDTGETDPETGNKIYLHGGETVDGVWQPKKPDVRGYFPRFLDPRTEDALDPDAPRSVCSTQEDALAEHKHDLSGHFSWAATGSPGYKSLAEGSSTITNGIADGYNKSTETRPANIALPGLLVMYGGYSSATGIKVEDLLELTEADARAYIDEIADPITGAVAEAKGYADDAKGYKNEASGFANDASGYATAASGSASEASGYANDAEGYKNQASGFADDASGYATAASGSASEASGYANDAKGYKNDASGYANEAKGYRDQAGGYASDALGYKNDASGFASAASASATQAAQSKPVSDTYTLASANWGVDGTYALSVTGLTATSTVLVSPVATVDGSNETLYADSGIRALSEATDTLTFKCSQNPSSDVSVVVVYYK